MEKRIIKTDKNKRQLDENLNGKFPLKVYYDKLSDFVHDSVGCHWHPELEFMFITQGEMDYQVNESHYIIKKGEGIFVNANVLHGSNKISEEDCHYKAILVDSSLIGEITGGIIYEKYINPILSCAELAAQPLCMDIEWQKRIIDLLVNLSMLYNMKSECYELDMLRDILSIWHILYENTMKNKVYMQSESREVTRMKNALLFIQTSYNEKITLDNIAAACSLSKSEMCKLFKKILHQTPTEYIMSYRISRSLPLIASDKYSVTEIAQMVGFTGASYFTESFRKIMGKTPSQYKKEILSK